VAVFHIQPTLLSAPYTDVKLHEYFIHDSKLRTLTFVDLRPCSGFSAVQSPATEHFFGTIQAARPHLFDSSTKIFWCHKIPFLRSANRTTINPQKNLTQR